MLESHYSFSQLNHSLISNIILIEMQTQFGQFFKLQQKVFSNLSTTGTHPIDSTLEWQLFKISKIAHSIY
jgi:hypothetical protein